MADFDPDVFLASQGAAEAPTEVANGGFDPDAFIAQKQSQLEDAQQEALQAKFGTPGQQTIAGLEGVAKGVAGPLATRAEMELGVPGQNILARQAANPWTHGIGEVAGLVGPGIVTGGESLAARATMGGLLSTAGEAGVKAAGIEAPGVIGKVGSAMVRGAVENTLYQSADEVSKMVAGDPNQSAETAAMNIGLSSLIGAGAGGAFGTLHPLWEHTTGSRLGQFLGDIKNKMNGESIAMAPDLAEAVERTGVEVPAELKPILTEDPEYQRLHQSLLDTRTTPGQKYQTALEEFNNNLGKNVVSATGKTAEQIPSEVSDFQEGAKIQDKLASLVDDKFGPVAKKFDAIKDKFKNVGLSSEYDTVADKLGILAQKEGWTVPSLPQTKLLNEVLTDLPHLQTLENLRQYQSNLWAKTKADPGLYNAAGKINSILRNIEEDVLEKNAAVKGIDIAPVRQAYGQLADVAEQLNERLRTGKWKGPQSFVEAIKEMKPEEVLSRLTRPNDAGLLSLLQKEFPSIVEDLKNYHINDLYASAINKAKPGQEINLTQFRNKYEKLTPEMKDFLFNPQSKGKIEGALAIDKYLKSIPRNFSNTAPAMIDKLGELPGSALAALSWLSGHNPAAGYMIGKAAKWASVDAPDAIRLAYLKFLGSEGKINSAAFKTAIDYAHALIKGNAKVNKAVENVFKAGAEVIPSHKFLDSKDLGKIDKKVEKMQASPEDLLETGGELAHYMPEHGTALALTANNAVNYLNSVRPKEIQTSPLDEKLPINKDAEVAYQRTLAVAAQPLIVLHRLKEGTLSSADINTMKAIYPNMYNSLKQKLYAQVVNRKADEEGLPQHLKMGLSLFMGMPLDSNLMPQVIAANQAALSGPQLGQQAQQQQPRTTVGGLQKMKFSKRAATRAQELEEESV